MRKHVWKFIALSVVSSTPVLAADMPIKATAYKAPPPPVVFNWTGFYLGAHGGCGWTNIPTPTNYAVDAFEDLGAFTAGDQGSGCFAGGQVGYNYQLANGVVLGVEADAAWASIRSSQSWNQPPGDPNGDLNTWNSRLTSFGTVRGRLGYASGQWLPYVTGGFAWGRNRLSSTCWNSCDNLVQGGAPDVDPQTSTDTRTHSGWVLGAGLEYALGPNWSIKGEYLHLDLGSQRYNVQVDFDFGVPPGADFGRLRIDTVKFGVNYRFGAGPVVAKY